MLRNLSYKVNNFAFYLLWGQMSSTAQSPHHTSAPHNPSTPSQNHHSVPCHCTNILSLLLRGYCSKCLPYSFRKDNSDSLASPHSLLANCFAVYNHRCFCLKTSNGYCRDGLLKRIRISKRCLWWFLPFLLRGWAKEKKTPFAHRLFFLSASQGTQ